MAAALAPWHLVQEHACKPLCARQARSMRLEDAGIGGKGDKHLRDGGAGVGQRAGTGWIELSPSSRAEGGLIGAARAMA